MKRRLLDLLRCPRCHGAFHLEAFAEAPLRDAPADPAYASEIEEGALACAGCGARFPIIAGVPRLIGPALLPPTARRYPDFVARANNRAHPRCHLVQANVLERPFRAESFDVVWSFGVLHHMPDPRAGFRAIVSLARPDGGLVVVWVYGYRGMAFTYRLSHMRPLHRALHSVSGPTRGP